jgi:hypothetical protein
MNQKPALLLVACALLFLALAAAVPYYNIIHGKPGLVTNKSVVVYADTSGLRVDPSAATIVNGLFTTANASATAKISVPILHLMETGTAPACSSRGDVYYDTSGALCLCDAGSWNNVWGTGTCS